MTTLQEYLNNKYPTQENKEGVKKISTLEITEPLQGGELDLRAFKNLQEVIITNLTTPLTKIEVDGLIHLKELILPDKPKEETEAEKKLYEELGISANTQKKTVVQEVKRLAELKGIKVDFGEKTEESADNQTIYLSLDKKDKDGNFCPHLVFWTLAWEITKLNHSDINPPFWTNLAEELTWVKETLSEEFSKDFENLLNPATFPHQALAISEFLTVYYPNSENIPDSQTIKTMVNQEIVDKTWQTIQEKLMELTSQELNKNPTDEEKPKLALKATLESSADQQCTIQVNYHSQSPLQDQIKELIIITPLKLEIEHLKHKQEQLPTSENFAKLTKEKQALENSLQDLTDEDEYKKIKEKINKIK